MATYVIGNDFDLNIATVGTFEEAKAYILNNLAELVNVPYEEDYAYIADDFEREMEREEDADEPMEWCFDSVYIDAIVYIRRDM